MRAKNKVLGNVGEGIKKKFSSIVNEKNIKFNIHYDGKALPELDSSKVKPVKEERIAVLAKSPDLPGGEQLLAIPALESGKGLAQKEAIVQILQDLGVLHNLIGVCQDTTGANKGIERRGAYFRLCKELKLSLLCLDCRRHMKELHIKHMAQSLAGPPPQMEMPCS